MSGQLAAAAGLIAVVLAALLCIALIVRRTVITRRGGVVECALRHGARGAWLYGLAEYRSGQLWWHRSLSLRLRPHAAFDRSQLAVLRSRPAAPDEAMRLGSGVVIVECEGLLRHRGGPPARRTVELAMSPAALTGLLAWLEASPIYPIRRAG